LEERVVERMPFYSQAALDEMAVLPFGPVPDRL